MCDYQKLRCRDSDLIEIVQDYQAINGDFNKVFDWSGCVNVSETCDLDTMKEVMHNEVCENACSPAECNYSGGLCQQTPECVHSAQPGVCLQCPASTLQYYTYCVTRCARGYTANTKGVCFPVTDSTSSSHPDLIYVRESPDYVGSGTSSDPYGSLVLALASLWAQYTTILLIGSQVTLSTDNLPDAIEFYTIPDISSPLEGKKFTRVTIRSLTCSDNELPGCAEGVSQVVYAGTGVRVVCNAEVVLQYLELTGEGFFPGSILYCPSIKGNLNDRGQLASPEEIAASSICPQYRASIFFSVKPTGVLYLQHLTVHHFSIQMTAFISIEDGQVYLEYVDFLNNTAYPTGKTALILQTGPCNPCGSLSYHSGSVQFTNNGFEYDENQGFNPFISLQNMQNVLISTVNFEYNCFLGGTKNANSANSMVFLGSVDAIFISNCQFYRNLSKKSLILIESALQLSLKTDENGEILSFKSTHFTLEESNFIGNVGQAELVKIIVSGDVINISVTNCEFRHNSLSSAVFSIENQGILTSEVISGGFKYLSLSPTSPNRQKVYISARKVTISNVNFIDLKGFSAVVRITGYCNVDIRDIAVTDSGDMVAWTQTSLLTDYIGQSETYMSLQPDVQKEQTCKSMVQLTTLTNFAISTLNFRGNRFNSTFSGLLIENCQGSASISALKSLNMTGNSTNGAILHLQGALFLSISQLNLTNNVNFLGYLMRFQGEVSLEMTDSVLKSNTGGGIYLENGGKVSLNTCLFAYNICLNCLGTALFYSAAGNNRELTVSNTNFTANQGLNSAGMYVTAVDSANYMSFLVVNCRFEGLTGTLAAAAVYFEGQSRVSAGSKVEKCWFEENKSAGATVEVYFAAGKLSFSNCTFRGNNGSLSSNLLVSSATNTEISLLNTLFMNSKGETAILKSDSRRFMKISMEKCVFEQAEKGCLTVEGAEVTDSGSLFQNCHSAAISAYSSSKLTLTSTNFTSNSVSLNGGAVYLGSKSIFTCFNCIFSKNNAGSMGGAVYIEQNSEISVKNGSFIGNFAKSQGSGLYISSVTSANLTNVVFLNNSAGFDGTISALSSNLTLKNVTFDGNLSVRTPGISLLMSSLLMLNSRFSHQSGSISGFLSLLSSSVFEGEDGEMREGEGGNAGGILCSGSSVKLGNWRLEGLKGGNAGGVYAINGCEVEMREVEVRGVEGGDGAIVAVESRLSIHKTLFRDVQESGVTAVKVPSLSITGSSFINSPPYISSGLICTSCSDLFISNCTFANLSSSLGGAVYVDNQGLASSQRGVTIINTEFGNNTAVQGGGLYVFGANLKAVGVKWVDNVAEPEDGGGVYMGCDQSDACNYALVNCTFIRNRSSRKGGGVSWSSAQPTLTSPTDVANSAPYGPLIASFPVQLLFSTPTRLLSDTITEAPGQPASTSLTASLLDHYGQVYTLDNTSTAELVSSDLEKVSVSGVSRVTAVKGVFTIENYSIYAAPNSSATISLTTTGIPVPDTRYPSTLSLSYYLRSCLPGESQTAQSCLICSTGTYGFDPSQPCQNCPQNAQCLGNKTVLPEAGYWKAEIMTAEILGCPNKQACLGGDYENQQGVCAEGYTGTLCQSCEPDFSHSNKNTCSKCPSLPLNISRLSLILLSVLVIIAILVWSTLRSAQRPAAIHSIYLKILMNYLQLVLLTADFKLNWPEPVLELFDAQSTVGGVSEQAFSVDCFLATEGTAADAYYRKMLIVVLIPIVLILLATLFWSLLALKNCSKLILTRQLPATIVILFFLIHPNLVKMLFSMFSCEAVNSEYWLTVDMSIPCWDSSHIRKVLTIGLPGLVVWVFGVPTICLCILVRYRRKHDELWVKLQYGFLINGYKRQHFYWEFVILYRKIVIICCGVFLTTTVPVQALTVQVVLLAALFLQYDIAPYTVESLNSMELRAIMVADVTIYCGLYYLTDSLSSAASWFFFLAIVIVNALFLLYWVKAMIRYILLVLATNIGCIGRIFHPEIASKDSEIEHFLAHRTRPIPTFPRTALGFYRLFVKAEETVPCVIPTVTTVRENAMTRTESLFAEHVKTSGIDASFSFYEDVDIHAKSP